MDKEKFLVALFTYNNGEDLALTCDKFPIDYPFDVVIHVDGSTDHSDAVLDRYPFKVIRQPKNIGIGGSLRHMINFAEDNGYEAIGLLPGNNKNDPRELIDFFDLIDKSDYDYIQGSRFLSGAKRDNTPVFRLVMVKVLSILFSSLTGRYCSDPMEGVRAYKIKLFFDNDININQDWLEGYALETYIHTKVLLNKKIKYGEHPVSKLYPENKKSLMNPKGKKYSHIRPFIDWWHILQPFFMVILRLRK
jgi:dolichol-phosphate mannosyltransferase